MIHKHFPLALAPMVGLSHVSLRRLVRSYLPLGFETFWPTEMLNSRRIPYQRLGSTPETLKSPGETNLVPQLLANEKRFIEGSITKLKDWGAIAIDINMGCPVKKALKHNYGVSLMGDQKYAAQIVKWAREASDLPVTVKLRAGIENDSQFLKDFLLALQDAGASFLTLHPRLAKEKRRGRADWDIITWAKEILDIPLVGNGDIQTYEDIEEMRKLTNCDGVMIGRALNARPWLLLHWILKNHPQTKSPYTIEDFEDPKKEVKLYAQAMLKLLDYLVEAFGEEQAIKKFRFHIMVNHMWISYGNQLISICRKNHDILSLKRDWMAFFEKDVWMIKKTNLRY